MVELTYQEKRNIEILFEMKDGFVLDFSNRSFREFIFDTVKIDINDRKFLANGESKANRLRTFLKIESDYIRGQLVESLCEYWLAQIHRGERNFYESDEYPHKECLKIVEKLKFNGVVGNLDVLDHQPNDDDDFKKLSAAIKECIEKNKPETGLDRLHTFVMKFIRKLCIKHNIETAKEMPLHSLFGMYIKFLSEKNLIESEMTIRILKSSISVMESFNKVRNEQSFAHDNTILNYSESVMIFNTITNTIKFIENIELKIKNDQDSEFADWGNWELLKL